MENGRSCRQARLRARMASRNLNCATVDIDAQCKQLPSSNLPPSTSTQSAACHLHSSSLACCPLSKHQSLHLPVFNHSGCLPLPPHNTQHTMSEVQSRPSGTRGRGGYRGGRGGYRGTRVSSKSHTKSDDQENFPQFEPEDQGEVGELKKKYGDRVSALRELCEGWSDEDLVYALKETNGDANLAFDRISGGKSVEVQAPYYTDKT